MEICSECNEEAIWGYKGQKKFVVTFCIFHFFDFYNHMTNSVASKEVLRRAQIAQKVLLKVTKDYSLAQHT